MNLTASDYTESMLQDQLDEEKMLTYDRLVVQKKKVERAYKKKVKYKFFKEGDLVWKLVLLKRIKLYYPSL